MQGAKYVAVLFLLLVLACTRPNPEYCESDAECLEPGRPFCDIEGEYAESGFINNKCSPIPDGCPVERCGCEPGESLQCEGDQLTLCGGDGRSMRAESCALGCANEKRCLSFTPSNGLGAALDLAWNEPEVFIPEGARIDTGLGRITDAQGEEIAVLSIEVVQSDFRPIRAFIARSFSIESVRVEGELPLALVASGAITVKGLVDAGGRGALDGPGAQASPALCAGTSTREKYCGSLPILLACTLGASGGGNATSGGDGGRGRQDEVIPMPLRGGSAYDGLAPLRGGCRGGAVLSGEDLLRAGGGGGGAVQLVSGTRILFTGAGFLQIGGGGGSSSAGGGSGGNAVLEAPTVEFIGDTTGLVANGGAGGACDQTGADGTLSNSPALAPTCSASGGDGGAKGRPPRPGVDTCSGGTCEGVAHHGGGGGAVGRVRFATVTGAAIKSGVPTISAEETNVMLVPR